MKADNETKITGFSMFFGAVLFAVCIIVSCDRVGHKHVTTTTPSSSSSSTTR